MHKYRTLLISSCVLLVFGFLLGACQRARSTAIKAIVISPYPTTTQTSATSSSPQANQVTETSIFVANTPEADPQRSSQIPATPTVIGYAALETQTVSPITVISSPTTSPNPITSTPSQTQSTPTRASPSQTSSAPTALNTTIPQYPGPEVNLTQALPYPGPEASPTFALQYPGPILTDTPLPSPGPATPTQGPTPIPSRSVTPEYTQRRTSTIFPSPIARTGTPGPSPTELPPKPPISPPPPGSSVTIWHSWGSAETTALQSIVQSFQHIYPNVTFSLLYVPLDDLHDTYQEAAYLGSGPDLLLGPADWGPGLFDQKLVTDLSSFVPPDFLSTINPAALASGKYQQFLISLPLSQHGTVMFRNTNILKTAPLTFEELDASSHAVTHGGIVGSYLERGSNFSAANIIGLGGTLMDNDGYPTFNNQFGLEWFDLLTNYDEAGAVTFNNNWDLEMFKRGRVGIIIDGTWNISLLTQAIGEENLAIDPWPSYGTGHMSGWVESDSVFFNTVSTGDDRSAALAFMGYLLDPNVQMRLAEVGHIPSVTATIPRDPLIQQAMKAFSSGATFPITVDQSLLNIYQKELDKAIQNVFVKGAAPSEALKLASDNLVILLNKMQTTP